MLQTLGILHFLLIVGHMAWHFPGMVIGMEQMMCFFTAWFAKVETVEVVDIWIFVTETNVHIAIHFPQGSAAIDIEGNAIDNWLTAAANAAARAGHDFDKVVARFTGFDGIQQFASIAKTTDNGNLYFASARDGKGGFASLTKLYVTHFAEVVRM